MLLEEGGESGTILDVEVDELEAGAALQGGEAVLLEADVVVVVEVIHAHDGVAEVEELGGGAGADEAGGTSEEEGHGGKAESGKRKAETLKR